MLVQEKKLVAVLGLAQLFDFWQKLCCELNVWGVLQVKIVESSMLDVDFLKDALKVANWV